MMKFTIDAKILKAMMEKGVAVIDKKATNPAVTRLYFQVDEKGIVKIWGTDFEHWAEVRSDGAYNTQPGILGVDINDIKIISNMKGEITLEDVATKDMDDVGKINVKCGKKTVSIPRYANTDIFLPSMDDTEEKIVSTKENWLLETITNLATYTSDSNSNELIHVFNFNTKYERIEALDGYRLGMRTLKNQIIHKTTENNFDTVKIHNMCVPVFKKLMNKKSEREVTICQDKKYIRIEGNDFTYVTRRIDGEYFKVEQLLNYDYDFKFVPHRDQILEVMKYDADLNKTAKSRKPVMLHIENGILYSYIEAVKYEAFDEIEVNESYVENDTYIGFNARFLADAFSIVDSDKPVCYGTTAKSPIIIEGDEYSFLVLPCNIDAPYIEKMNNKIREVA